MKREDIIKALKELEKEKKKKKFLQVYDLIINLKDINLKNPDEQIDMFVELHYNKGRPNKICALVGPEMLDDAKKTMDFAINADELEEYKDKKKLRKLADSYDYFIAQANLMGKIATVFGKVLGVRGKMPNPKAGCVVPPKTPLQPIQKRLKNTVRLKAKTSTVVQIPVGNEDMPEEQVVDNILTAYNALIHKLPNEENNVKSVILKLTMSKPVRII